MLDVNTTAANVEHLTGHSFTNKLLAAEAVQMAAPQVAVVHGSSFGGLPNNKRLSILGDAVLAKTLCSLWYSAKDGQGNELPSADWTNLRNALLSNESLSQRGSSLGIEMLVFCNEGTVVSAKMVATALAAIIGAVHQDGGDLASLRVIQHLGFTTHPLLVTLHISHPPR